MKLSLHKTRAVDYAYHLKETKHSGTGTRCWWNSPFLVCETLRFVALFFLNSPLIASSKPCYVWESPKKKHPECPVQHLCRWIANQAKQRSRNHNAALLGDMLEQLMREVMEKTLSAGCSFPEEWWTGISFCGDLYNQDQTGFWWYINWFIPELTNHFILMQWDLIIFHGINGISPSFAWAEPMYDR